MIFNASNRAIINSGTKEERQTKRIWHFKNIIVLIAVDDSLNHCICDAFGPLKLMTYASDSKNAANRTASIENDSIVVFTGLHLCVSILSVCMKSRRKKKLWCLSLAP